jgi:hypothetical protein
MEPLKPIQSKHVFEMLTVANEFCHFIEGIEGYNKQDIIEFVNKILPMMYLKGTLLPGTLVSDPGENEKFVNEMIWERVFYSIKDKLGDDDKYWVVKNTGINEYEPQEASLADNLADIYQDMKDFIVLYQKKSDAAKENALADIRNYFQNHWGEKALQATSRMHDLLYDPSKDPFDGNHFSGLE